jgi:hypothetical protein
LLGSIFFLHLNNKKEESEKRFTLFCNREDRERQSCQPPIEAVEANVVVSEDKIFSQSKCTHQAQMSEMHLFCAFYTKNPVTLH